MKNVVSTLGASKQFWWYEKENNKKFEPVSFLNFPIGPQMPPHVEMKFYKIERM